MSESSQFALLKQRRFVPFFITQALGAFNDNVFKNSLMLLLTFGAATRLPFDTNLLMNVAAGLFILPFLLFSGVAGRIADKYNMDRIIRIAKVGEIVIMSSAALAYYFEAYVVLILLLFMMGSQSAFFGPVKYALLPKNLSKDEIVGGNALVEMGTFLAILAGTIYGGILVGLEDSALWISVSIVVLAMLGYFVSRNVPEMTPNDPSLIISWNIFSQTKSTFKVAQKKQAVFLSMMAISWFWFMGASYLTQIPNYTKTILSANNEVVTLLLAVFSIGVALGSLCCEKLSEKKVELGIVPIGSIGLSLFGIALYFDSVDFLREFGSGAHGVANELIGVTEFIQQTASLGILFNLGAIGFFGGLYSVPLMALIQQRSDEEERAQTIAANNILNALLMVVSAISGVLLLTFAGLSIPEYFLVVSIVNIAVAVYIYSHVPEFLLRFIVWVFSHTIYRVSKKGFENIPDDGPAVIVCNHVSYMDPLILAGACRRPVRFVMDKTIYNNPGLNWFFKLAKTIPIASQKSDPELYTQALDKVSEELQDGNVVCIFPEGRLTKDGEIDTFRRGIESIIERDPVVVVPMALKGLWGSFFSHKDGVALSTRPTRFWSKIRIESSAAWEPSQVSAGDLEQEVKRLRGAEA